MDFLIKYLHFECGLKVIAELKLIILALIALEIYLKNYVLDNAMQDWCQKCAFRLKKSAENPFKDIKEEEKEFNSAVLSV